MRAFSSRLWLAAFVTLAITACGDNNVPEIDAGVNAWAANSSLADWIGMSSAQFPAATLSAVAQELLRLSESRPAQD